MSGDVAHPPASGAATDANLPGAHHASLGAVHSLSGAAALGHALAGTLLLMSMTMTGVQDMVAAMGGATGTLLVVHCGTLLMLTWTGAQVALVSEGIERRGGTLVVRAVRPGDVARRIKARWWWFTPSLLVLHLALGWIGGGSVLP